MAWTNRYHEKWPRLTALYHIEQDKAKTEKQDICRGGPTIGEDVPENSGFYNYYVHPDDIRSRCSAYSMSQPSVDHDNNKETTLCGICLGTMLIFSFAAVISVAVVLSIIWTEPNALAHFKKNKTSLIVPDKTQMEISKEICRLIETTLHRINLTASDDITNSCNISFTAKKGFLRVNLLFKHGAQVMRGDINVSKTVPNFQIMEEKNKSMQGNRQTTLITATLQTADIKAGVIVMSENETDTLTNIFDKALERNISDYQEKDHTVPGDKFLAQFNLSRVDFRSISIDQEGNSSSTYDAPFPDNERDTQLMDIKQTRNSSIFHYLDLDFDLDNNDTSQNLSTKFLENSFSKSYNATKNAAKSLDLKDIKQNVAPLVKGSYFDMNLSKIKNNSSLNIFQKIPRRLTRLKDASIGLKRKSLTHNNSDNFEAKNWLLDGVLENKTKHNSDSLDVHVLYSNSRLELGDGETIENVVEENGTKTFSSRLSKDLKKSGKTSFTNPAIKTLFVLNKSANFNAEIKSSKRLFQNMSEKGTSNLPSIKLNKETKDSKPEDMFNVTFSQPSRLLTITKEIFPVSKVMNITNQELLKKTRTKTSDKSGGFSLLQNFSSLASLKLDNVAAIDNGTLMSSKKITSFETKSDRIKTGNQNLTSSEVSKHIYLNTTLKSGEVSQTIAKPENGKFEKNYIYREVSFVATPDEYNFIKNVIDKNLIDTAENIDSNTNFGKVTNKSNTSEKNIGDNLIINTTVTVNLSEVKHLNVSNTSTLASDYLNTLTSDTLGVVEIVNASTPNETNDMASQFVLRETNASDVKQMQNFNASHAPQFLKSEYNLEKIVNNNTSNVNATSIENENEVNNTNISKIDVKNVIKNRYTGTSTLQHNILHATSNPENILSYDMLKQHHKIKVAVSSTNKGNYNSTKNPVETTKYALSNEIPLINLRTNVLSYDMNSPSMLMNVTTNDDNISYTSGVTKTDVTHFKTAIDDQALNITTTNVTAFDSSQNITSTNNRTNDVTHYNISTKITIKNIQHSAGANISINSRDGYLHNTSRNKTKTYVTLESALNITPKVVSAAFTALYVTTNAVTDKINSTNVTSNDVNLVNKSTNVTSNEVIHAITSTKDITKSMTLDNTSRNVSTNEVTLKNVTGNGVLGLGNTSTNVPTYDLPFNFTIPKQTTNSVNRDNKQINVFGSGKSLSDSMINMTASDVSYFTKKRSEWNATFLKTLTYQSNAIKETKNDVFYDNASTNVTTDDMISVNTDANVSTDDILINNTSTNVTMILLSNSTTITEHDDMIIKSSTNFTTNYIPHEGTQLNVTIEDMLLQKTSTNLMADDAILKYPSTNISRDDILLTNISAQSATEYTATETIMLNGVVGVNSTTTNTSNNMFINFTTGNETSNGVSPFETMFNITSYKDDMVNFSVQPTKEIHLLAKKKHSIDTLVNTVLVAAPIDKIIAANVGWSDDHGNNSSLFNSTEAKGKDISITENTNAMETPTHITRERGSDLTTGGSLITASTTIMGNLSVNTNTLTDETTIDGTKGNASFTTEVPTNIWSFVTTTAAKKRKPFITQITEGQYLVTKPQTTDRSSVTSNTQSTNEVSEPSVTTKTYLTGGQYVTTNAPTKGVSSVTTKTPVTDGLSITTNTVTTGRSSVTTNTARTGWSSATSKEFMNVESSVISKEFMNGESYVTTNTPTTVVSSVTINTPSTNILTTSGHSVSTNTQNNKTSGASVTTNGAMTGGSSALTKTSMTKESSLTTKSFKTKGHLTTNALSYIQPTETSILQATLSRLNAEALQSSNVRGLNSGTNSFFLFDVNLLGKHGLPLNFEQK